MVKKTPQTNEEIKQQSDNASFLTMQCKEYIELANQYYHASGGEVYQPKSSVGKKVVKKGIIELVRQQQQELATSQDTTVTINSNQTLLNKFKANNPSTSVSRWSRWFGHKEKKVNTTSENNGSGSGNSSLVQGEMNANLKSLNSNTSTNSNISNNEVDVHAPLYAMMHRDTSTLIRSPGDLPGNECVISIPSHWLHPNIW